MAKFPCTAHPEHEHIPAFMTYRKRFGAVGNEGRMPRFLSKKLLCFTIPDRPVGKSFNGFTPGVANTLQSYVALARFCAKNAVVESGWELTKGPIYMIVSIYNTLPNDARATLQERKDAYGFRMPRQQAKELGIPIGHNAYKYIAPKAVPNRSPTLFTYAQNVSVAFKGIIYADAKQIAGLEMIKKYSPEPHVDFLFGRVDSMEELYYDLAHA